VTALRVGLIVPSSNTVVEPELARLAGAMPDLELVATRIAVTRIDASPASRRQFEPDLMIAAARLLADAGVDVLVWAGTSGCWLGVDHDRALVSAIEDATGIAATSSTLALLDACHAFGASRLFLLTPYVPAVVEQITGTLATEGLTVSGGRHLGICDNAAFGSVPISTLQSMISEVASSDCHAVAVVCTNLRALPLLEADVERSLGVAVLDSVAATVWGAARRIGVPLRCAGFGALLAHGVARAALQSLCDRLLAETGADRVTVRLDAPEVGLHVDWPAAEALHPGVKSIRWDPSLDQRALETVCWLDGHRRLLVQPHFNVPPYPPQALRDVYGVAAQILAPVPGAGSLRGWLSVHSIAERDWTPADEAAARSAAASVAAVLDGGEL
jgi:maleate isomerase